MLVGQGPGSPVLGRNKGHFPVVVTETLPPLQLDDAAEAQALGQGSAPPGHDGNFGRGDLAQGRFVEVIEVRVGEQHQVDGWQILHPEPGSLEALEQEEPVGEIGIDDGVEPLELHQKRGVTDPGQRHLIALQVGKIGNFDRSNGRGLEGMPHHFSEEGPWIEMVSRSQIPEGPG